MELLSWFSTHLKQANKASTATLQSWPLHPARLCRKPHSHGLSTVPTFRDSRDARMTRAQTAQTLVASCPVQRNCSSPERYLPSSNVLQSQIAAHSTRYILSNLTDTPLSDLHFWTFSDLDGLLHWNKRPCGYDGLARVGGEDFLSLLDTML